MSRLSARELRVALVGPAFPPQVGGIEVYLEQLAAGLSRAGCQVEVLVQGFGDVVPHREIRVDQRGFLLRRFPSWTGSNRFPVAPALAAHLIRHSRRYDVIHGHSYHAVAATMAALLTRNPFVYTAHYHRTGHTPMARALHLPFSTLGRRTFAWAQTVVSVSQHEAALIRADFAVQADRIRIVHPGIDVQEIIGAEPFDTTYPVILTGGRLEHYKQVDRVIRAVSRLPTRCVLAVLGTGPESGELQALARDLGIEDRTKFLGRLDVETLRRWQRTAAVLVSMSRHEAFGMTLAEVVAGGGKVVASSIPTHREIDGLAPGHIQLVDVDANPDTVAAAIERQLDAGRGIPGEAKLPTWGDVTEACLDVYLAAVSGPDVRLASYRRR